MQNTQKIFISGATSAIAQAFARRYATQQACFYLLARDETKLEAIKQDLLARGASEVSTCCSDLGAAQDYTTLVDTAITALGHIDIAVIAQGVMFEQADAEQDNSLSRKMYEVNTLSAIEIANALGNHYKQRNSGALLMVSSVAGDRGRQSNYIYGSTKAALSVFTDGLRHRLAATNATIVTVKPGFVDTPMTSHYDKGPLWAQPEKIAEDMEKAIRKRKGTLYTPWFWRYIMLIIQHIPEFIFKRLSL